MLLAKTCRCRGCGYWMIRADRMWLEGKQEEDGGMVAERSKTGVTLPSHWVTMAPWGECCGVGEGVCICGIVEAGIWNCEEWKCSLNCSDSRDKVIGWEKKQKGRGSDWRKKEKWGWVGQSPSLLAAGGVCVYVHKIVWSGEYIIPCSDPYGNCSTFIFCQKICP